MGVQAQWFDTMGTLGSILSFLVIMVGLILTTMAYLKNKNQAALLSALGFLLMSLFGCCSLGGILSLNNVIRNIPRQSLLAFMTVSRVVMIIVRFLYIIGLALIVAALLSGGQKEH